MRGGRSHEELPVRSATPTQISHGHYPHTSWVTGSAHSYANLGPPLPSSTCMCHLNAPHPSEGWYVAYHAAIPGIYQGL